MRKERVAVGVEEVRGTQLTELFGERADLRQARVEAGNRTSPQGCDAFQERAERMLRVGVPDPEEATTRKSHVHLDARQVSIVREEVHTPSELAREGLRVSKERLALGGASYVREHEGASDLLTLKKGEARAVVRRPGLANHERVTVLHERDSPAVFV